MANIVLESVKGYQIVPIDDIFLRDRRIFFCGEVNDESCNILIKKLLYLESHDTGKPITLFINSPGGNVGDGLSVYDTIRIMQSPVTAVVTGIVASMGSIILCACDADKRLILPNSKIMIHDCSWGRKDFGGKKPHEIEEELKQLSKVNEKLVGILAERCGKSVEEVAEVTKNDTYFDAEEAIEFGLASEIIDTEKLGMLMKEGE